MKPILPLLLFSILALLMGNLLWFYASSYILAFEPQPPNRVR